MKPNYIKGVDATIQEAKRLNKKAAVFVIGGEWCPWCVILKKNLALSDTLDKALIEDGFVIGYQEVDKKAVDTSGIRDRFSIPGIPFFIIFDEQGKVIASTEYPGEKETPAEEAMDLYVKWVRSHNDDAL